MNSIQFACEIKEKKIKNGTKFEVYRKREKIGTVGVIDSMVVYLDMKDIPQDLLIGDYIFKRIESADE